VKSARNGTEDQLKAQKALEAEIAHRKRDDRNVILMWKHLFGKETSSSIMLASVRQPAVDETNCLKMLVRKIFINCFFFFLHNDFINPYLKVHSFYAGTNLRPLLWPLFNIRIEVPNKFRSHMRWWILQQADD
jgi:hypothetical protein